MSWGKPTTDEQKRYYDKHAPERSMYGWLMMIVLLAWAVTDFAGFRAIFSNGFDTVAFLKALVIPITLLVLFMLHSGLFISCRTYFFDTLDDDPNTDSTIFLPLLITALLIFGSREGNKALMESWGHKAEIQSTAEVDQRRNEALAIADNTYQQQATRIRDNAATREAAIRSMFDNQIKSHERTAANTNLSWKKAIAKREITRLKAEKNQQLDSLAISTATLLDQAYQANQQEVAAAKTSHSDQEASIISFNQAERAREADSQQFARRFSWVFAVGFAALFWLIMWRYTTISVKSGIMPKHEFSDLETRGGVMAWYWMAFKDIFTRQSIRAAVWMHRQGITGTEELRDFNDEFIFKKQQPQSHQPSTPLNGHHPINGMNVPATPLPGKN